MGDMERYEQAVNILMQEKRNKNDTIKGLELKIELEKIRTLKEILEEIKRAINEQ